MGDRIRQWLSGQKEYDNYQDNTDSIESNWMTPETSVDYIKWNYLGFIDQVRTTKALYESNKLPMTRVTWIRLCYHCVEECIVDFWTKISTRTEYLHVNEEVIWLYKESNLPLSVVYWKLRLTNQLDNFIKKVLGDDITETPDEYMFKELHFRNEKSVHYFWKRLNDTQRKFMIEKLITLGDSPERNWFHRNNHTIIGNIKARSEFDANFLMNSLRLYSRYGYEEAFVKILESSNILPGMLKWPLWEKFWTILESTDNINEINWTHVGRAFDNLMLAEMAYLGDDSNAKQWFYRFWDAKDSYGFEISAFHILFMGMVNNKKLDLVKYIATHGKTPDQKREFEECLNQHINTYEGRTLIIKFMMENSNVDNIKEWFRENSNAL
uniref:Uncharacterized protein n=1 Tax=Bracon brevicornis TaxID=1563983 RepID=A0A6V7J646_9HYME